MSLRRVRQADECDIQPPIGGSLSHSSRRANAPPRGHGPLNLRAAFKAAHVCPAQGHIWRVQNGMFAEHWDELNLMQMFQQIGALPPLGGLQAQA